MLPIGATALVLLIALAAAVAVIAAASLWYSLAETKPKEYVDRPPLTVTLEAQANVEMM